MHKTTPQFWQMFYALPDIVQKIARRKFELLKENPRHPSLRFKKAGKFWSARAGLNYRALTMEDESGYIWVWMGSHDEYARMLR